MLRRNLYLPTIALALSALLPRFAHATIGGFAATLAAEFEEMDLEMKRQQNQKRLTEKLTDKLLGMQKQMADEAREVRETRPRLEAQIKHLHDLHNGAPEAEWAPRYREELATLNSAKAKLDPLETQVAKSLEDLKTLKNTVNSYTSDNYQKRFQEAKARLEKLNSGFDDYKNTFSVEPAKPGDSRGSLVVRPAKHVEVSNDSDQMIFKIKAAEADGWTVLEPGKVTQVTFRAGEHGQIMIQAMTLDKYRKQLTTLEQRFANGEMKSAKLTQKTIPYAIAYGNGTLATSLRSTGEEYRWQNGSNVERSVGKLSPWSAADFVTPAPKLGSSRETAEGNLPTVEADLLTWWLPRVEDGSVDFTFTATGHVKWVQERTLATGRTTTNDETEVSSGALTIRVTR